jgi:hypothetical protein
MDIRALIPIDLIFNLCFSGLYRGRYDFELFPTFMKVRGKNKEYRVLYSSVTRLTHLEIPNGREHQIIVREMIC